MRGPSRLVRNVAGAALVIGLFAGTFGWQTDDTWPLAQMRMFPGGDESSIAITLIQADLANGHTKLIDPVALHLRRAEIEGQYARIRRNPSMLGALIDRYNRTVPHDRSIVRLSLVRKETVHTHGRTQHLSRTLVRWPA